MQGMKRGILIAALSLFGGLGAQADEAAVWVAAQALVPDAQVSAVRVTPIKGLYEVVLNSERGPLLVYINEHGTHALAGDLLDIRKQRNLSEERLEELTRIGFDELPLNTAVKLVKGNGKRRLAVFSDPDCPFCRRLEKELAKVDDLTMYVFLYPIAHPKAMPKAKQIWCAQNRAKAWTDYMLDGKLADNAGHCSNPVDATMALGRKLNIQGTPTLIFADGKRIPGFIDANRIERLLAESSR